MLDGRASGGHGRSANYHTCSLVQQKYGSRGHNTRGTEIRGKLYLISEVGAPVFFRSGSPPVRPRCEGNLDKMDMERRTMRRSNDFGAGRTKCNNGINKRLHEHKEFFSSLSRPITIRRDRSRAGAKLGWPIAPLAQSLLTIYNFPDVSSFARVSDDPGGAS
jgi:hypothetical protein